MEITENMLQLTKRADGCIAVINKGDKLRCFVVKSEQLELCLAKAMKQNNLGDPYYVDSPLSVVGIHILKGTKTTIKRIMKDLEDYEIKDAS